MNIALLGGVKSMECKYKELMDKYSCKFKLFNKYVPDMGKRMKDVDAVVLFMDTSSHKMVNICNTVCRKNNIVMKRVKNGSMNCLETGVNEILCIKDMCKNCKLCK
ncbi:MAG: DUF2325 domain-containing protein [Candidatus Delongbacteria bacterium]|nr:DUF2325 domain-containing protein [Candidatus Delongbacteria bacterium]MBN2834844.1 DUF2325 domain-containing protein [Candidatus Delongbacteria bacterium]